MIVCSQCGNNRPHKARKMCAPCYLSWLRKQHLVKCIKCPQMIHRHGKSGMCKSCCQKEYLTGLKYGYSRCL
jgi:hypothetical protein